MSVKLGDSLPQMPHLLGSDIGPLESLEERGFFGQAFHLDGPFDWLARHIDFDSRFGFDHRNNSQINGGCQAAVEPDLLFTKVPAFLQRAEMPGEADLLILGQLLVPEDQHELLMPRVDNLAEDSGREVLPQIEPDDFSAQCRR